MRNLFCLFFCGLSLFSQFSAAENGENLIESQAYYNSQGQKTQLYEVVATVQPGDILVVGENHGQAQARRQQLELLQALRDQGFLVSLGMEFFTYTDQKLVDQYVNDDLNENAFLQQINWGQGIDYAYYRDQVLSQRESFGELTLALNAPRSLTGQVAKKGLDSLSEQQRELLPPNLTLGNAHYRERFLQQMPHLPSPETADRYFAAQSIWDDTMAWQIQKMTHANPQHVLVVIVGDFHVQFGGGLPDRILARTSKTPLVISYQSAQGLSQSDLQESIAEHPVYGSRADYIWIAE